MSKIQNLDQIDIGILSQLMKDAKTPYTDIAKQLFVSSGTIHVRMRKMEELGLIKGSNLSVDYAKLGYDITAFLGIFLSKSSKYETVAEYSSTAQRRELGGYQLVIPARTLRRRQDRR